MSVISKDLAGQISFKITEPSRKASEAMHVEFRELVTKLYEDQIPEAVLATFKKQPDWFYTRSEVKLEGHGFSWEHIATTRPLITNANGKCDIHLTAKIADQIMKAKRKWQEAQKKYNLLREETKQALLTLKTYANIRKELPQAAPMLPPPISNALVCNFDSLRKQLQKQPEPVKTNVKA